MEYNFAKDDGRLFGWDFEDVFRLVRRLGANLFEFAEFRTTADGFVVVRGKVDLDSVSDADAIYAIASYGFSSLATFEAHHESSAKQRLACYLFFDMSDVAIENAYNVGAPFEFSANILEAADSLTMEHVEDEYDAKALLRKIAMVGKDVRIFCSSAVGVVESVDGDFAVVSVEGVGKKRVPLNDVVELA